VEKNTTDFGFQEVNRNQKAKLVKGVFDSVAENYDLMNDLMSFGIHRLWKRQAIRYCQIRPHHHVLDVAGGTGDLSLRIAPTLTTGHITVCDINEAMLTQARQRLIDQGFVSQTHIIQADAQALPFIDHYFDRIIIGFGLRNVTDKQQALNSMYRVLKPGGRLIVLEFSKPLHQRFSKLYDLYSFQILPRLGKLIAKDQDSYQYLAESIRMHPCQETLKEMFQKAGFDSCRYFNLSGGIVAVHQGIKY